jgi:hypothetical protein
MAGTVPTIEVDPPSFSAAAKWWQSLAGQPLPSGLVQERRAPVWLRRADEKGPEALVQAVRPVNRYADFVDHVVQRSSD